MTKQVAIQDHDLNKLTGAVVGGIWGVLVASGNGAESCMGLLPALSLRMKQYFLEFGWPRTQTDIVVFSRAAADRTEMVLEFFHLSFKKPTEVKKKIELAVIKSMLDFQKENISDLRRK